MLLDLVVHAFDDGATPETIVQMYSTLKLADVYAAIAYYLRHRQEIRDYLAQRERRAAVIRQSSQAMQPEMSEIRRRLTERRSMTGNADAADFHNYARLEFWIFWMSMLAAFGIGFLQARKSKNP